MIKLIEIEICKYYFISEGALIHGPICILVTFLVTRIFRGNLASTLFLFVFQLVYLLIGNLFSILNEANPTFRASYDGYCFC